MTDVSNADLALPTSAKPSRLRPENGDSDEEIVRAAERFAAFRIEHPEGFVDTFLERIVEHPDGNITYVVNAHAWKIKGSGAPDATAWAQGSTKDSNPIIAGSPLESADTIARSRALRNLGILPEPRRAT